MFAVVPVSPHWDYIAIIFGFGCTACMSHSQQDSGGLPDAEARLVSVLRIVRLLGPMAVTRRKEGGLVRKGWHERLSPSGNWIFYVKAVQ